MATTTSQLTRKRCLDELLLLPPRSLDGKDDCQSIMGQWEALVDAEADNGDGSRSRSQNLKHEATCAGATTSLTDSADESSTDDEASASDDEEETIVAQALVKAAFSRTLSAAVLGKLLCYHSADDCDTPHHPSSRKKARSTAAHKTTTGTRSKETLRSAVMLSMRLSASEPHLLWRFRNDLKTAVAVTTTAATMSQEEVKAGVDALALSKTKPDDFLRSLLVASSSSSSAATGGTGVSAASDEPMRYVPASSLKGFFLPLSQAAVDSYDSNLARAVRTEDVGALRAIQHRSGRRSLHAGNKFGETIVHAACRRGSVAVLRFLVSAAGGNAPLRVCCDAGRTPLHDACWTTSPPGAVIDIILDECPDLLYVTDQRGFTALSYVPRERWGDWCRYLERRGADRLRPREIW